MGSIALNVDGSAITNPGLAGFGCLMRYAEGKFLLDFSGSVGVSNILHTEIMAFLRGLVLCLSESFYKVICYADSLETIQLIDEANISYHKYGNETIDFSVLKIW